MLYRALTQDEQMAMIGNVAKLRGLDRKAGEEWAAMFGPHSMRIPSFSIPSSSSD